MRGRRRYQAGVSKKTEGVVAMLATFFVLLSAMFDTRVSAGLALFFLVVLAACSLHQSRTERGQ